MKRVGTTTAAVAGAAALVLLSGAPGVAATPVAQASATALSLTLGGQPADSGTYRVQNDGTSQSATGSNAPALTALGGQSLIKAGTLAQDATTRVTDGRGYSQACAGLAGQGATVAAVGDGATCLSPGQAVTINAGNIDLSRLQIVSSGLLQGFDQQTQTALQPLLQPLTSALQTGLTQALSQLGLAVNLDLGAVQSSCTAGPGTADGTARLAGARAFVQVGGQQVDLVNLPADPAPNTHVVGALGDVAALIENAVRTQLTTVLGNLPGGLALPIGVDQTAVLNNALSTLGQQLQPLQDNVIDVTLNKQTRPAADQIEVTALDVAVLPVAQQQFGVTAFDLKIGTSACGPSGEVAFEAPAAPAATPSPTPTRTPQAPPKVPTSVPAGLASADQPASSHWGGLLAVAGLLVAGIGAVGSVVRSATSKG
ncbi:hypothetical protein [Nocardioides flavescens]|uniref:Choice-of-anchor G family protein n=1 Tax=Nocardioides flavescens TaxID=2691959 RepID=A0A6L7EXV0_9ACTN|nr:hypothetical protein [Nocardioides flavescens]MXG90706.1 hypothetical protein [Nocardioides flavescens]